MARRTDAGGPRRDAVSEEIAAVRALAEAPAGEELLAALARALASRSALVVARAAEVVAARGLVRLRDDLGRAFQRLLEQPVKRDPGSTAKLALVRALAALETDDP